MGRSMQHWNGNQLCSIDCETTGLDCQYDEILQIAIIPLDSNIEPRKDIMPFTLFMKPEHPERIDPQALHVNKLRLETIMEHGVDRILAEELLEKWIHSLGLPVTKYGTPKKIIPLGQNYCFDRGFITNWLGNKLYDEYFDYHYVDTMITANYLNDRAAMRAEKVPFSKINLVYLASTLKIPHEGAHDAIKDAIMAAAVYKQMLKMGSMWE